MMFASKWLFAVGAGILLCRGLRGRLSRTEWCMGLLFALHFAVIQVLMFLSLGHLDLVDWRYHSSELAFSICLLVGVASPFFHGQRRLLRMAACIVLAAAIVRPAYKMTKWHIQTYERRMAIRLATDWAVDRISRDWKGPDHDIWTFSRKEYQTDRLPRILEHSGYIAYRTHGRDVTGMSLNAQNEARSFMEQPDYVLVAADWYADFVAENGRREDVITEHLSFNGMPFVFQRKKRNE